MRFDWFRGLSSVLAGCLTLVYSDLCQSLILFLSLKLINVGILESFWKDFFGLGYKVGLCLQCKDVGVFAVGNWVCRNIYFLWKLL